MQVCTLARLFLFHEYQAPSGIDWIKRVTGNILGEKLESVIIQSGYKNSNESNPGSVM